MSYDTTFHSIKSEIKDTISLSIPLIASQLIYACSGFIGTAMVAHLGQDALAASVLVSMIWMSLSVFFFGILNSVSVLVSHQFGANNDKAISEIMGQAFILGIIVTIIMVLLLCRSCDRAGAVCAERIGPNDSMAPMKTSAPAN